MSGRVERDGLLPATSEKCGMKQIIEELAIFGGRPSFEQPIQVGSPNTGDRHRFLARLKNSLDSGRSTGRGPFLREFEERVAAFHGVRHCIATASSTQALAYLVHALDLSGEVIVPSFMPVATAHALNDNGITPVCCDVDPASQTLDPGRVDDLVTAQTSAIIGAHLWGRACDVDKFSAIARRHNLSLLFDAAHAFACTYHGRKIGTSGQPEILSFHASQILNAFEGAAILTDDETLSEQLRAAAVSADSAPGATLNGQMNEISAAMGLTLMDGYTELVAVNLRNYRRYRRTLAGLPGIQLIEYDYREQNNYHHVVLEVDPAAAGVTRDQLMAILSAEKVHARRYFCPPCHWEEPYRSHATYVRSPLPVTEKLARTVLCLPTGTAITGPEIDIVCNIIRLAVTCSSDVSVRLHYSNGLLRQNYLSHIDNPADRDVVRLGNE